MKANPISQAQPPLADLLRAGLPSLAGAVAAVCAAVALSLVAAELADRHTADLITARREAYTAGREQALQDLRDNPRSAVVSETCLAWWFDPSGHSKQQALQRACHSRSATIASK